MLYQILSWYAIGTYIIGFFYGIYQINVGYSGVSRISWFTFVLMMFLLSPLIFIFVIVLLMLCSVAMIQEFIEAKRDCLNKDVY